MIIKNRVFKVEKMGDFIAQKNSHDPPPKYFYTPKKAKKELDEYEDFLFNPIATPFKKITPISSSNRLNRAYEGSRSPLSREPLPPILESPNLRTIESRPKKSNFRIPSRSTPRLEPRVNLSSIKLPMKKPLYNEKHIEIAALEDNKRKMIDRAQLKTFNDRYKLDFVTGYHNMNILTRCVELLNSEHDPFILENIIPNKFKEYVAEAEKNRQGSTLSYSEISNSQVSSKKSTQGSSFVSYLPDIRKSQSKDGNLKREDSNRINKTWETPNGTENKISTISSTFSLGSRVSLPKIDLETFKNALDYFKSPEQEGIFVYIKTLSKGVMGEFGFCELVWNERKKNVACITKFFVPRAYRKMRMVLPITLKLVEHLFKTLKLEKLVIKLLAGNTFAQNDLRILGFKLEKIDFEEGKKMKLFSMKKIDLEDLLSDLNSQEMD